MVCYLRHMRKPLIRSGPFDVSSLTRASHSILGLVEKAQAILWGLARVFVTGKCNKYEKSHVLAKMQWKNMNKLYMIAGVIIYYCLLLTSMRGGSRISYRRFGCKGVWVRFADFISFF